MSTLVALSFLVRRHTWGGELMRSSLISVETGVGRLRACVRVMRQREQGIAGFRRDPREPQYR